MKIDISEKDLFLFVHFHEKLNEEVRDYIQSNYELYKSSLEYLKEIGADEYDSENVLPDKISALINNPVESSVIRLTLLKDNYRKQNGNRLAANSETLKPVKSIQTFASENGKLILKFVPGHVKSRLYLISDNENDMRSFNISLNNEQHIEMKCNGSYYEIESSIVIKSVTLQEK